MLLCAIEKCGTAMTRHLLLDLNRLGRADPALVKAVGWSEEALYVQAHDNNQVRKVWSKAQYDAALASSEWTKFLLYRDPLVRFISGWASKCTDGHDADRQHCILAFGANNTPLDQAIRGLRQWSHVPWCLNQHWRPQVYFCGGEESQAHFANALLNRSTPSFLANFTSTRLRASDRDGHLRRFLVQWSAQQQPKERPKDNWHRTGATADMLDAFPDAAELKQIIREFYRRDYAMLAKLGVTPPH